MKYKEFEDKLQNCIYKEDLIWLSINTLKEILKEMEDKDGSNN